ncbi:MFS transporter [Pseudonocardia abyssalis]|uniref:MFS transporter n=1 Tax=Pseudonocardia abyssalis TaxID=2792008 RepID=A0ABS6UYL2_9PSEU|nr:MFS transporter [Pseudonocardia abyssalis]MBW0118377.1 MFS transporter [Pseudonocardia abyssalis]MBW0137307.1 MFS transporter [Pseudonocardia abyssalis]
MPTTQPENRLGFAGLVATPGYARLLGLRFSAQWGDGLFQAALGGALLFNPERQADPLAVAAGLAVLLLPYSLIGPFAGALLDRWDRRQVLLYANLLRGALVLVVAAVVLGGVTGPGLYVAALSVAGVARFILAGLSTALPHVVPRQHLVEANTLAVTAGAAVSALGGVSAVGLRALLGADDAGSAATVGIAVVGSVLAAVFAARFRSGRLGPDGTGDRARTTARAVAGGFADGARAVAGTPSVAASFAALAAHRLAFGVNTLTTLLLFRYAFTDQGILRAGFAGLGEAVVLAAAGLGVAAVVAPWSIRRIGRARTVRAALVVATVTQLALAAFLSLPAVMVAAFVIGMTGQVVKLCTDAAVQGEAGDGVLGRVFALYDIVFNVGYVLAVAVTALLSPPDGRAPLLLAGAALLYVAGLLAHDQQLRRRRPALQ